MELFIYLQIFEFSFVFSLKILFLLSFDCLIGKFNIINTSKTYVWRM